MSVCRISQEVDFGGVRIIQCDGDCESGHSESEIRILQGLLCCHIRSYSKYSLMGPLLFLLHISDMPSVVDPRTAVYLFADDALNH